MPDRPIFQPVRVNPVLVHPQEHRLTLDGTWLFRLDPRDELHADDDGGEWEEIAVPGCWQGQGFGDDSKDTVWDFGLEAQTFRATYKGTGWYTKTFPGPDEWCDKRIWLNFGGVHPSAEIWLNGVRLGENDLPFVPFGFEITDVVQFREENRLVVRVHEKHREFGLAYNWQGNWSGLYRGVELTATGKSRIEQCSLLPDVENETLTAKVRVGGSGESVAALSLRVRVATLPDDETVAEQVFASPEEATCDIPIPSPQPWSPDNPNLYRVDVELLDGDTVLDAQSERTGFVCLSTRGRHFLINSEPYYMRGSGDFISCPETGCPDTDRDRWRRKLQALRDYGYNYVRCQSYLYAPEYFDAADEVGLIVQSEMGMLGGWGSHNKWHVYQWPKPTPDNYPILKRQWDMSVRRDVNHPSANMYCMSNEYGRDTDFCRIAWQCYRDTKAIKPTAFVIWSDHGLNPDLPADFINWMSDGLEEGELESMEARDQPMIEHEFRWWSSFPDIRINDKYNGAIRPYGAEIAREAASRRGQEHLLETYADRSQRLQFLEAKAKMEACRRDNAHLAGINHFDAMDTNLSPQGIITEFYERKLISAETWLQTNGDTVIMCSLGFEDRVVTGGDTFECDLSVSDFSHPAFREPELTWRLTDGEQSLVEGRMTYVHKPHGTCPVGKLTLDIPEFDVPTVLVLEASLREGNRMVANSWRLWCFPQVSVPGNMAVLNDGKFYTWVQAWSSLPRVTRSDLSASGGPGVVLAERVSDAVVEYMQAGGVVVLAAGEGMVRPHPPNFGYVKYFFTPPANYSPYEDGQNGTVIAEHPMLEDLPHEGFADLQFFRMIENSPPLDLEPFDLHHEDPVIRVIHRYPVCRPLAYLLERQVGKGRLIITALELNQDWPEARYVLSAISSYGAGAEHVSCPELSAASLKYIQEMTML